MARVISHWSSFYLLRCRREDPTKNHEIPTGGEKTLFIPLARRLKKSSALNAIPSHVMTNPMVCLETLFYLASANPNQPHKRHSLNHCYDPDRRSESLGLTPKV
jgi:hypothetical protein